MLIEQMMFFALGALVASLLALILLPAVWKRAVRLTKRRIEAATPITMAEFRADKDQLRAEFAMATRKLELTIESQRARLAEQTGADNTARIEAAQAKAERTEALARNAELEAREASAKSRIADLERDATELSQKLRKRDREIVSLRDAIRGELPKGVDLDGDALSGDYDEDIDRLTTSLAFERQRVAELEAQASELVAQIERGAPPEAAAAVVQMREALTNKTVKIEGLKAAEARMASAESRLNALLAEAAPADKAEQLLADKLRQEANLANLRSSVLGVESSIVRDWQNGTRDSDALRAKLAGIADDVSRVVYSLDNEPAPTAPVEESLFERVQRFADDGEGTELMPTKPNGERRGSVADRMTAIREIQGQ
jgi:hypothetical protein